MRSVLCLVRHGSSTKTDEDRHGGDGFLTACGKAEVLSAAVRIMNIWPPQSFGAVNLYSSHLSQCHESAKILSNAIHARIIIDRRIAPLYLGVLNGLTTKEAETKDPAAARRLQDWREGKREISEIRIPESEDLQSFWNRGKSFIEELPLEDALNVVVGTRSILILLVNVLLNHSEKLGRDYCPVEMATGAVAAFTARDGSWRRSEEIWEAH